MGILESLNVVVLWRGSGPPPHASHDLCKGSLLLRRLHTTCYSQCHFGFSSLNGRCTMLGCLFLGMFGSSSSFLLIACLACILLWGGLWPDFPPRLGCVNSNSFSALFLFPPTAAAFSLQPVFLATFRVSLCYPRFDSTFSEPASSAASQVCVLSCVSPGGERAHSSSA